MSEGPVRKIVITKEDLLDPKIDEAITIEQSYGARVAGPVEEKRRFSLFYSNWFYLMLAGAIGAFAAWALIEPYFADGIIFSGRIEQVDPQAVPFAFYGTTFAIKGRIRVAGADVYVIPEKTRFTDEQKKVIPYSIGDLKPGQVITVMGEQAPDSSSMLAVVVQLQQPDWPVTARVSVSELATTQIIFAFLLFPMVAAFVGLMIGSVEGIICRTFSRAAWCGAVGLIAGLVGGAISVIIAGLIFALIGLIGGDSADPTASAGAFVLFMFRRGLAWTVAGVAMGLGQGIALKSGKLVVNAIIGGMVGGLLGGLLFDPINLLIAGRALLSGAEASRAIGLTIIGGAVGLMIGFTDMLTRDAWLKVIQGPLRGKEFSFNRTPIRMGSSPKNEIYLFKDLKIDPNHAEINKLRDTYELVDNESSTGTFVNGQRIKRHRLADGDSIHIGDSEFSYSTREKKARS
ncbi:MAG: FHA domain-containing protein [Blastocatellia bacterium]|nr:FHA domain-containing protein [Blastocatellia bacterium]